MVRTVRCSITTFLFTALMLCGAGSACADATPVRVEQGQLATVADIAVEYEDGTPAEDGIVFDAFDMSMLYIDPTPVQYVVHDGVLSGVAMHTEIQYLLGFDSSNPYRHALNVCGYDKSKKLLSVYARYEGQPLLAYDSDEGINAAESPLDKIVLHKLAAGESADDISSDSCALNLVLSEGVHAAQAGVPISLVRADNAKKSTVYSRQGQVCLNLEADTAYTLIVEENPVYELIEKKIDFSVKKDSQGLYHAVRKGYDVEDAAGRLGDETSRIELKRIDGKANPKLDFADPGYADEADDTLYAPDSYELVYEQRKVVLRGMPVYELDGPAAVTSEKQEKTSTKRLASKSVALEFFNATLQRVEGVYETENGYLPDIEMTRGHSYIVTALDADYEMPNYYIKLNKTGGFPVCTKCFGTEYGFFLTKRAEPVTDVQKARRVHYELPVYYQQKTASGSSLKQVSGVKFRLVSPNETVEATSAEGKIAFDLVEDWNYMVLVDDASYGIESFPLTMKDKSEYGQQNDYGQEKFSFNHFSCGSVNGLLLVDKGTEHDNDTVLVSPSRKTSVTGLRFGEGNYFVNDRQLDNSTVSGLKSGDYEVFAVEAINMYRIEISKLATGSFTITREVPKGKQAVGVYYLDDSGVLVPLDFSQKDAKVTFKMGSLSLYPNVIEYAADKPQKAEAAHATPETAAFSSAVPRVKTSSVRAAAVLKKKRLNVSWKAVAGASAYRVEYRLTGSTRWSSTYVHGKTTAVLPKMKTAGLYQIRVTACKKTGKSWACGSSSGTLHCYFNTASGVRAKAAKRSVRVTWKKDRRATGYQIIYSKKKSMKGAKTVTVRGKAKTNYTIKGLKKGVKYYVQVRPVSAHKGKTHVGTLSAKKAAKAR